MSRSGVGGGSVRDRINAYEGRSFQEDPDVRKQLIADWMNIPARVVDHAVIHQGYFDNFTSSTRPTWFKRESVLKEVEDWMRTRYKMTQNELTSWLQGDDGPYKMYRNLATEHDAHAIERPIMDGIKQAIGHNIPANLAKRRTDVATFGP